MKEDFKVGDLVTFKSLEGAGTVRHTYRNSSRVLKILVEWRDFTESYMPGSLRHYQEPLEYFTGEEVRVGDVVYSRYLEISGRVIKLRHTPIGIILEHYGHEGSASWGLKGDDVELLRRTG